MSLLNRLKKLEKNLPGETWDGEITPEDTRIAAKRIGLRDYKYTGELDEKGNCKSFELGTDDMQVLHEVLTMKKAAWGNMEVEVSFFNGEDEGPEDTLCEEDF